MNEIVEEGCACLQSDHMVSLWRPPDISKDTRPLLCAFPIGSI